MSTEQRADDDVVPSVAGGGFDAVLASSMLHSARIPAKWVSPRNVDTSP